MVSALLNQGAQLLAQFEAGSRPDAIGWLRQTEDWLTDAVIGDCRAAICGGDLLRLLGIYDLIHRQTFVTAPDDFLDRIVLRLFDDHFPLKDINSKGKKKGVEGNADDRINEHFKGESVVLTDTELYDLVADRLRRRRKAFFGRPLHWLTDTLSAWYQAELHPAQAHNFEAAETTAAVKAGRARRLMAANLRALTPDPSSFRHLLSQRYSL